MPEAPPRVFISYSHDDAAHQKRVLDLANRLRREGVDAIVDQYEQFPPEGWPAWCEAEIRKARFVLIVCTETYFRRVNSEEEPGRGHGVLWEARLIRQFLFDEGSVSRKFVPVLFGDGSSDHIPTGVRGNSRFNLGTPKEYENLYRFLTNQPRVRKPDLGELRPMPELHRQWDGEPPARSEPPAEDRQRTPRPGRRFIRQIDLLRPDPAPGGYQVLFDISLDDAETDDPVDPVTIGEHAATFGRDVFFQGPERSGKTTALNAFLVKSAGSGRSARVSFHACAAEELVSGTGLWQRIAQSIYEEVDERGVEPPGMIQGELQLTTYLFVKVLRIVHPLAIGFDEVGRLRNKPMEESFYRMIREWRERDNRRPPARLRIGLAGLDRLREFSEDDNASRAI
jgi:SEFIR domain